VAGDITYNPEPRRDWVRAAIALSLIFALLAISGAALYSAHGDFDKTKELLDKLLPALAGQVPRGIDPLSFIVEPPEY
jgi:hypothetical protein